MKIKILSPLWGYEQEDLSQFLDKINKAGYNGIDTWIPAELKDRMALRQGIEQYEMCFVAHQHEAEGKTFNAFRRSFLENLNKCAEFYPQLINSHTGRDYFTTAEQLQLLETAQEFSEKTGIQVVHETHRGRLGYSPQMMAELFNQNDQFKITADFSHWVCVTESMLANFTSTLSQAIQRSRHIHARVGFEQGPQVADPRAPEWKYALDNFLGWWDEIVKYNDLAGTEVLTFTTEFGPYPYMPQVPFTRKPVADQFAVNCFLKDLLFKRYEDPF